MHSLRTIAAACAAVLSLAAPLAAEDVIAIKVTDPYARASSPSAKSGAVFMLIRNESKTDDRLVDASSDVAARVELHTHIQDANGVMRMIEVEDGISLPAGGNHGLVRGGDHIMLMGLTRSLEDGTIFPLTLVFEQAGPVTIDVPVDLARKPGHGMHGGGNTGHDTQSQ